MEVVSIAGRPDLVPVVASWVWHEFWRQDLHPLSEAEAEIAAATAPVGPPQCFVLLVDGVPVGTASFTAQDLDERPDLTPWLASVFVVPEARGKGHVYPLIAAVEAAARDAGFGTLWLFTPRAERVYARAGWHRVEVLEHRGQEVVLMRREVRT